LSGRSSPAHVSSRRWRYREGFGALLELHDNQRFSRGTEPDRRQLDAVIVRRLKTDPAFAKKWDSTPSLRAEIAKRVPHHHNRELALAFVDRWREGPGVLDASVVAIALHTAATSVQKHHDAQSVELVWTAPDTGEVPFRRTEQAILQVLDSARERLLLVSYTVYAIPNIQSAVVRAAQRGVQITVVVETPSTADVENEYSTLRALGSDVAACSRVYYWPKEKRRQDRSGKVGILHVKCAVADGTWLFLSSANLTEYAFTINMELGTLIRGGQLPAQVEANFAALIAQGALQPI
jgi:phosphatidylserine/phosphatidylglycerophosphate/cardiolipin synthase-like enzyme